MKFTDLGISDPVAKAVAAQGIVEPTTIQEKSIPMILEGKDVIGISRTGSGKTASFGIPLIEMIDTNKRLQGLIITPTRELAVQISQELVKWSKHKPMNIATVYGGVSIAPQQKAIRTAHIVVATPGRLCDHIQRGNITLKQIKTFILDEADKMVEMGFVEDIERVLAVTNPERQILLFGATISDEVGYIKRTYMKKPMMAEAQLHVDKDLLEQYYVDINQNMKFSCLMHLIKESNYERMIIFCSTKRMVSLVQHNLREYNFKVGAIHGDLSQSKRLLSIEKFNKGKINILCASAVAARGIDIRGVSHVINYDLPRDPQEYVHRVGRTARGGGSGIAITLLAQHEHPLLRNIIKRYKIPLEEMELPKIERYTFHNPNPRNRSDRGHGGRQRRGGPRRNSFSDRPPRHGRNRSSRSNRDDSSDNSRSGYKSRGPRRESSGNSGGFNSKGPKKPRRARNK